MNEYVDAEDELTVNNPEVILKEVLFFTRLRDSNLLPKESKSLYM